MGPMPLKSDIARFWAWFRSLLLRRAMRRDVSALSSSALARRMEAMRAIDALLARRRAARDTNAAPTL